jgi:hypothetical protein
VQALACNFSCAGSLKAALQWVLGDWSAKKLSANGVQALACGFPYACSLKAALQWFLVDWSAGFSLQKGRALNRLWF